MDGLRQIICITCPKGCRAKVWREEGSIRIKGKICRKGRAYVEQEFIEPKRVLTSTVVVQNSHAKRLPVRTVSAIPKADLFRAMAKLSEVEVTPPIRVGSVIVPNIVGTGVDVIASDDLFG
jgi:CxxC motif-containing protein